MSKKKNKLVQGWGVNDVDYNVGKTEVVNGEHKIVWRCPYYRKWAHILERCFDLKYQERQPTYKGCTIHEDWKYLSSFIEWVDSQPNKNWQQCVPDKDFLSLGNKHYSHETVVFISGVVNNFITDSGKARGDCMVGVSYYPKLKKNPYHARCRNPFTSKQEYIGCYPTELEAHKAWQAKKHEYALQLADIQEDDRVAKALRERYAPDKDWSNM